MVFGSLCCYGVLLVFIFRYQLVEAVGADADDYAVGGGGWRGS
jgi:hypothetical protein